MAAPSVEAVCPFMPVSGSTSVPPILIHGSPPMPNNSSVPQTTSLTTSTEWSGQLERRGKTRQETASFHLVPRDLRQCILACRLTSNSRSCVPKHLISPCLWALLVPHDGRLGPLVGFTHNLGPESAELASLHQREISLLCLFCFALVSSRIYKLVLLK